MKNNITESLYQHVFKINLCTQKSNSTENADFVQKMAFWAKFENADLVKKK